MNDDYLFNKYEIYGVIEGQTQAVKKKVQSIASNIVLSASEADLIQALSEEFTLSVPVLSEENIYIAHSGETQVDVSRDPMRMIVNRSHPFYIAGNKTVIAVPFEGDASFFKVQPQSFTLSPPRAKVAGNELLLTYVTTNQDANAIKPTLASEDYADILGIMKNMVQVIELSPHAFVDIGEEELRFHFLVQLNGAYQGQASGETFNFQGKTDILIRVDGKNIFVAECKFWKGEKSFLETLDQLLSYLSWRDTKAAVLIFNRNANFSAVLEKIAEIAPKHKNFKRYLGKSDETTFRYVFGQSIDPNREVVLTVLAFDIPTKLE